MRRFPIAAILCLLEIAWIAAGVHTTMHMHGKESSPHSHNKVFVNIHQRLASLEDRSRAQSSSDSSDERKGSPQDHWEHHIFIRYDVPSHSNRPANLEPPNPPFFILHIPANRLLVINSALYSSNLWPSHHYRHKQSRQLEAHSDQILTVVMRC